MKYKSITFQMDSAVESQFEDILRRLGVSVQEALESFCRDVVASGRLPKQQAVIRPKSQDEMTVDEFRARIKESVAQMERGEGQTVDEAFTDIRRSIGA